MSRIGILGGTFDPPHIGHIAIAEAAVKECLLSKVLFVPARFPPHKRSNRVTSDMHRLRMLKLAIDGHPGFEVSDIELKRDGLSYTVETLRQIKGLYPDSELVFIIGADNVSEMEGWHEPGEILKIATVVAFNRPGFVPEGRFRMAIEVLHMVPADVSSSEIRKKVRENKDIKDLVPGPVRDYIENNSLYRS